MILFLNHAEIEITRDTELKFKNELGMTFHVIYKDRNRESAIFSNCHEIHFHYNDGNRVALESNLHSTGITIDIDSIKMIAAWIPNVKHAQFEK